jgi:nucleoid-associated protein YgaU
MTRETKIGLLVGLAFIIVIGILLSDHFRTTMEPTQAALVDAAQSVREAISSPGKSNPPITIVVPQDAAPKQSIPTKEETNPPVVALPPNTVANNTGPVQQIPQGGFEADGPGKGTQELANIARRNGMEIVTENAVPTPYNGVAAQQTAPPAALKSYTALAGDSVSHMAAKLMGADNRANRQAIINANSSLQDDPDLVVVGQTYMIPTTAGATAQIPSVSAVVPTQQQPAQQTSQFVYTVKEGDSLWRIANDQLGDAGAVEAIKSLNLSVLKGPNHDILTIGAKLRLPSKPLASAN